VKVKYIRIIRSSNGKFLLGSTGVDEGSTPIKVEPHALGGVVPGFLVYYPGGATRPDFIPSSNVERAVVEDTEPAGLSVRPAMEAAAKKAAAK